MIVPHVPTDRLDPDWPRSGGLTAGGALAARQRYGPNDVVEAVEHPWWALARDTARDPMLWFFAGTSAMYGVVGQFTEAATLLGAIVPLVLMDVFLHRRTQASTEGLKSRLASRATVVRDGAPIEVPAREVVPGDLVTVTTGETFPADGIVLTGADLQVDESSLTGESYPVRKRPVTAPVHASDEPRVGHEQWVFAGTRLLTGRASLVRRVHGQRDRLRRDCPIRQRHVADPNTASTGDPGSGRRPVDRRARPVRHPDRRPPTPRTRLA